jgi:integrase
MRGFVRKRGRTFTAYWETKDPASGGRRQHSKGGFRTMGDARGHLNTILGSVQDGSWSPERRLSVRELLEDHWLPAQRSRGLRPATIEQYEHVVADWIVPHVGGLVAAALRPIDVARLTDTLRTKTTVKGHRGLSQRSVQLTVQVLKAATRWGSTTGALGRDPLAGVKRPRVERSGATRAWTTTEARQFLAAVNDDRLSAIWAILLTRGLRRGELSGLRWQHVDLDAGSQRVVETRIVVDGRVSESTPKTNAGRRTIPLDESLIGLLRSHRSRQAQERLAAGSSYDRRGFLVADELGHPYSPDWISDRFEKLVAASELPRIRLHDCRHTAATLMLAAGTPTKIVAELLGHSSPTITLETYAHVLPGMAEQAGADLSATLLSG